MVGALRIAEQMTLGRGTLVRMVGSCSWPRRKRLDHRMIAAHDARFIRMNVKVQ